MSSHLPSTSEGDTEETDVRGEISLISKCDFEWTLMDFLTFPEEDEFVSRSFSYMEATWRLGCKLSMQWVHLCLEKMHSDSALRVEYRLGIRRHGGGDYVSRTEVENFEENGEIWKTDYLVPISNLHRDWSLVAPGGKLHCFCTFQPRNDAELCPTQSPGAAEHVVVSAAQEISEGSDTGISPSSSKRGAAEHVKVIATQETSEGSDTGISSSSSKRGADEMTEYFEKLFLSGDHSDIIIKVQDQQIPAHKLFLIAQSKVFEAMFRYDTIEKDTNVLIIEDCNPETFQEFLYFLYSGKLKNVSAENVIELYVTADKYQVDRAKSECVQFMMKYMSAETFCDFISLALRHNERELLNFGTDYFVKNMETIMVTVEWQNFYKEHPVESNELLVKGISHQSQK